VRFVYIELLDTDCVCVESDVGGRGSQPNSDTMSAVWDGSGVGAVAGLGAECVDEGEEGRGG
jgi:hypothetical protein